MRGRYNRPEPRHDVDVILAPCSKGVLEQFPQMSGLQQRTPRLAHDVSSPLVIIDADIHHPTMSRGMKHLGESLKRRYGNLH